MAVVTLNLVADIHKLLVKAESILVDFILFPEVGRNTIIRLHNFGVFKTLASDGVEVENKLQQKWDALAKERNDWRVKREDVAAICAGAI